MDCEQLGIQPPFPVKLYSNVQSTRNERILGQHRTIHRRGNSEESENEEAEEERLANEEDEEDGVVDCRSFSLSDFDSRQ